MAKESTVEDMVRAVLAEAVRSGVVSCKCDPIRLTAGEIVGPANALGNLLPKKTELPTVAEGERAERCETCRFYWNVDSEHSGLADCRRYPPVMVPFAKEEVHPSIGTKDIECNLFKPRDDGWPLVWPDDFCGEWQAKK